MTFIPSTQSTTDANNTVISSSSAFTGTWTPTNGYEAILLNIVFTGNDGSIAITFSPNNGTTTSKTITDTIFSSINYSKSFSVLDAYYRVSFSATSITSVSINSRLLIGSSGDVSQNTFYQSNESIIDAFGKLRVANPYTLLEIKFPLAPPSGTPTTEFLNNTELTCIYTTGSGGYTYTNSTTGTGSRNITLNGNGTYTSQSRKYCTYLPGKSMLVLCSGIMDAGDILGLGGDNQNNFKSRIGYFDNYNGFYFEYSGDGSGTGPCSVCYLNNGSLVNITQSSWNIDKMNGSGTSTLNLDFTKAQLFVIDFEWLGVGRIRYGFYAFGKINYCHQITNINALGNGPYMRGANLPVRYEVQGGVGIQGGIIQICSTVISEGGYNPMGRPFTANNGLITTNNVTTAETPLLAIKGGPTYNHQNIIPLGVDIINAANVTDPILYRVRYFLSPSPEPGTFAWTNVSNYSVIQYAINPTGVTTTGSIIVEEGYFAGRGSSQFNSLADVFSNVLQITSDITGISDIILVTAQVGTGNAQVSVSIQWQEIY